MENIYFFTNIVPSYRIPLWNALLNKDNWYTHFFYSDDPESGIKMIDKNNDVLASKKDQLHKVKCLRW